MYPLPMAHMAVENQSITEDQPHQTSTWGSCRHVNNAHKLDLHLDTPHEDETLAVDNFESQKHQMDLIDEICHVDCNRIGDTYHGSVFTNPDVHKEKQKGKTPKKEIKGKLRLLPT